MPTRAGCRCRLAIRSCIRRTMGPEVAEVMWAPAIRQRRDRPAARSPGAATASDLERAAVSRKKRASARVAARRLIREHDLPMKVSRRRLRQRAATVFTVYFSAPHRVDFRSPRPRSCWRRLGGRVELRQHRPARRSPADRAGSGSCGRDLCCSTFLKDFRAGLRADGQGPGPARSTRCASPGRAAG